MPVVLDVSREVDLPREKKDYTKGVALVLDKEQTGTVVLTKYISVDPLHADWQPPQEWLEEVIVDVGGGRRRERIQVGTDTGVRGLQIDDGLIVRLVGTMTRVVGILKGRPPLNEDEVDAYNEVNEEHVPLFQQWDFRIASVLKTSGPQDRLNMIRSEDQKRLDSQAAMFEAITKAFQMGMAGQAGNLNPDVSKTLNTGVAQLKNVTPGGGK